jgi:hypothetical protein
MELLKVFVGDGTASPASVGAMTKGDVLLLNASTYEPYSTGSGDVVIAVCTDKGVEYSTPIKKTNVLYANYTTPTSYAAKKITFSLGTDGSNDIAAGGTYSLGIQIKEDLRMGTYNKNTEVIASHTCVSSTADKIWSVASTLAKGFSANPMTSAGSPYQLVKVVRTSSATTVTILANDATVTQGAREVLCTAHGFTGGELVILGGNLYTVEGKRTDNIFTLDTAYQGPSRTLTKSTSVDPANGGSIATGSVGTISFVFEAVAQTMKNRYDQFRLVEFDVIYPKGWVASAPVINTKTTYPVGSYRQIRDLEEKAYTNSTPLINYREFPFEDFVLNADPTQNSYCMLTITYNATSGYNYLQSNMKEFPQTLVVAAPALANALFDNDSASFVTFAELFNTWYGTAVITSNP